MFEWGDFIMGKRKRAQKTSRSKLNSKVDVVIDANVNISDFADANKTTGRVVKSLSSGKLMLPGPDDDDSVSNDDENEDFNGNLKNPANNKEKECKESGSIQFPFDLWYILSNYIHPESVGTFARLCQDAFTVVNRAAFWLNLYRKYAVRSSRWAFLQAGYETLPSRLQSDYVHLYCHGNLRVKVIRALYFAHKPFRDRLLAAHRAPDSHSIIGMICLGAWTEHKARTNKYKFCFKLTSKSSGRAGPRQLAKRLIADNWESGDFQVQPDVSIIAEESYKLLQLDCDAFSLLPGSLPSLRILDVCITSSGEGFRYQKMAMTLGPAHLRVEKDWTGRSNATSPHTVTIDIGNVVAMRVLEWYHPLYTS